VTTDLARKGGPGAFRLPRTSADRASLRAPRYHRRRYPGGIGPPASNSLMNRLALRPGPWQLRVDNDLHRRTGEFSARIRTLPPCRAEFDGPLDDTDPHSSIGGRRAAGVGYSMRPLARLVFLGAVFSTGSVRHLETLLSTKLDSSATNDLSTSSTRASADRRCVLDLGAAPTALAKLRRVEIQASEHRASPAPPVTAAAPR
jgi:hypothetical protein